MRIDVEMTCPFCGAEHSVEVNLAGFKAWQNGELIQRALPELSATEREQLISQMCPKCQASFFCEDEEDEDFEEPEGIDSDFGFDPYEGCYTYDCQQVQSRKKLKKVLTVD